MTAEEKTTPNLLAFSIKIQKYASGHVAAWLVGLTVAYSLIALPIYLHSIALGMNGYPMPDLLPMYSPEHLYQLAASYSAEGRVQYIRGTLTFDLAYPLLYGSAMVFTGGWLARSNTKGNPAWQLLPILPLLAVALDLLENASVAAVMALDPAGSSLFAIIAALATPLKWLAILGVFGLLLLLLLRQWFFVQAGTDEH